ncbi:MAG: FAD-binding oxidoreductase [Actinomycetota bacterium]|nr:FAD-binding oxidoreductase [Actinomycetota bacterium]
MDNGQPILVIGAGVTGLTTAVTLAEAGHPVQVCTAEPPEATTSAVAGALWGPWLVEPRQRVLRWAEHTLTTLRELAADPQTGVRLASGIDVSDVQYDPPDWAHLLSDRRPCMDDELPQGYRYGTHYTAPLVTMPRYLTYLGDRLRHAGGAVELQTVDSLDEVAQEWPIVVNCSGLGSRALVADHELHPIRGQHVLVTNPGLTDFLEADTGDSPDLIAIYPHADHVVLGGTAEPGQWNREPSAATTHAVLARCTAIEPRLSDARPIGDQVGLRPTRPQIRVSVEQLPSGTVVAHNYGHGGAGVSVSWGCATEIRALLDKVSTL